jgi:hypothetical protein
MAELQTHRCETHGAALGDHCPACRGEEFERLSSRQFNRKYPTQLPIAQIERIIRKRVIIDDRPR